MFRKATLADVEAINNIYQAIHDQEEAGKVTIGWIRAIYPTKQTAIDAINKKEMYVLIEDNHIVGAAKINQEQVKEYADAKWDYPVNDNQIMVLHTLVIDPAQEHKGYASKFVKFYEDYALEHNCHYLRMDTNAINTRARKLYQKLLYKEVSIVRSDFNGIPNIQLVCLEKKI